ncbi:hypothetical protein RvY_18452 [Ramazzottius varieornatus]|uniref:Histone-lysine N-methyltransferase n=1 Tax=Ramazzottius varieornatus TaxID=947166 RepID=A0A1D1W7D3_RAMVA|nr:hypothetical protein RvY_18452 [Ramazzottius varieornatus]
MAGDVPLQSQMKPSGAHLSGALADRRTVDPTERIKSMLFSPPLPTSVGSKNKTEKHVQPATASNDDFDQLLASIHTKISQDFGATTTSTTANDLHASPMRLSPVAPASASSAVSIAVNGSTPPKEIIMTKAESRKLKKLRSSLNVQDCELLEVFSSVTARLSSLELSEAAKKPPDPSPSKTTTKPTGNVLEAESVKMLPFKKRAYKGDKVPSPKTTDGGTKTSGRIDGTKEKNGPAKSLSVTSQGTAAVDGTEKLPTLKLKVSRTASGKVQTARTSTSTPLVLEKTAQKMTEIQVVLSKTIHKPLQPKKILPLLMPKATPTNQPGVVLIAPKPAAALASLHCATAKAIQKPVEKPMSLSESLNLIISPPTGTSLPVDTPVKKRGRPRKRPVEASTEPANEASVEPPVAKKVKLVERPPKTIKEDAVVEVPAVSEEDRKQMEELQAKFRLTRNIYSPKSLGEEMHKDYDLKRCDCKPPAAADAVGCGYGCSSRSSYFECDPEDCPCGKRCTNNAIQKKRWAENLELFKTDKKGFGVRCLKPIRRGSLICEYVGEVVSWEVFRGRSEKQYNNNLHHYCLKLDSTKVIDAYSQGGIARFINHSCEPNSHTQNWVVKGRDRIAIFASKDIPAGEEITYDYKFESFDVQQPCFCGSKNCRGFTGVQKSQKLNGLLMKKRMSSSSTTPTLNTAVTKSPAVTTSPLPSSSSKKDLTVFVPPLNGLSKKSAAKESPPVITVASPSKTKPPVSTTNGWLFAGPSTPKAVGFPARKASETKVLLTNGVSSPATTSKKVASKDAPPATTPATAVAPARTPTMVRVVPNKRRATDPDETGKAKMVKASSVEDAAEKEKKSVVVLTVGTEAVVTAPAISVKSAQSTNPQAGTKSPLPERRPKKLKTETSGGKNGPSTVLSSVETASSGETDLAIVRKERFFLPRNLRKLVKDVKKQRTKRPKVSILCTPIELPALACEALKRVRGSNRFDPLLTKAKEDKRDSSQQLYPPSYFRPAHWEPSAEDIIKYYVDEVIRCSCGIYLEDGRMTECEQCKTWQHNECVGVPPSLDKPYKCPGCLNVKTPLEIHQNLPAALNLDSLDCYTTLMAPNCQNFPVRVGDCVYLTKDRSPVNPDALYDPLTLDIVRVDKMWIEGTTGNKKLYGNHYLRPHETYHEASRSFYENELLRSPIFETVALEAVLGRCCIMDPILYATGKPKEYPIEHCFICELKTNKKAASFGKMKAHEKLPINEKAYYFDYYPEKLTIRRTLKPHGVPVTKKKQKANAARRKSDQPKAILDVVRDKCERIQIVMDRLSEKAAEAQDKSLTSSSSSAQTPT